MSASQRRSRQGSQRCSRRSAGRIAPGRSRLVAAPLAIAFVMIIVAGCGVQARRGVEIGHLRDLARRVEGGGAECPLAIRPDMLRPATVDDDAEIIPLRTEDRPGSEGFVGEGLPTKDSVRIICRFETGGLAVTLDVVGVTKGHAIGVLADQMSKRGDAATVLTFIDVNGDLAVGRARGLPGAPPAAFARVAAATGDIALVLSVDRIDPKAQLPKVSDVERDAESIAAALSD